jgi:hypothetical protein
MIGMKILTALSFVFILISAMLVFPMAAAGQPSHIWNGVTGYEDIGYDGTIAPSGASFLGHKAISGDGRFVAFYSSKPNIVAGVSNGFYDVFVRDRLTQQTELISIGMDGLPANGPSYRPAISANGRHVAFRSNATNLVPGNANGISDVFVRDRLLDTTTLISTGPSGEQAHYTADFGYRLSADGRFVAFVASFTSNSFDVRLWLRDRDTDGNGVFDEPGGSSTIQISPSAIGGTSPFSSYHVAISGDGRIVAYNSQNPYDGTSGKLFVYDRETGLTKRVDAPASGLPDVAGDSTETDLDDQGRYLVYTSKAPNLVPDDGDTFRDLFVCDLQTGVNSRVRLSHPGAPALQQWNFPSISGDGRYVSFNGALVPYTDSLAFAIDLQTGVSREISFVDNGTLDANPKGVCESGISADGSFIAFDECGDTGDSKIFVALDLSLSPTDVDMFGRGGSLPISVTVPPGTPWTARTSNPAQVELIAPTGGIGPGVVTANALWNYTGVRRETSVYVGSERVQVHQQVLVIVSGVSPGGLYVGGGTVMTIDGQGFAEGATVKVGGSPATDVQVINPNKIIATAPGAAGYCTVDLVVTNPDGSTGRFPPMLKYKDVTPPVLTPHISGTLGDNGWYTGLAVVVSWDVTDPESAIIGSNCEPTTYMWDGLNISSCTADSDGGHSSASITIKKDCTQPHTEVKVPGNGAHYSIGQQVAADYLCSDPYNGTGSGVAQCTGTVPVGSYLDTSQPGTFPFTVAVRDMAGNQNTYNGTYMVDGNDPGVVWPTPAPIPYGTPLGPTQLNASANVPGTFIYTPAAGTILPSYNNHTLSVTFVPDDPVNYRTATKTVTLTVQKIAPTITWAAPASISYGTPLSSAQLNATANASGTFSYTPAAGTVLSIGAHTLTATFTSSSSNYTNGSMSVSITVDTATPVISWATPASIVYGTPLGATQLNASANVPGVFTYNPAAATVLPVGTQTLTVTFTPNDTTNYTTATKSVTITVIKAASVITWTPPSGIVYGTPLGATQLNASANVPGMFTYTPATGTILPAGSQILSASFAPNDTANYVNASKSVSITVSKALPVISWTPANIVYGAALGADQLNATANTPGTFTYTPTLGTVLPAGTRTLSASFVPNDTSNFQNAGASVSLTVARALLAVQADNAAKVYGQAIPAFTATVTGFVAGDSPASLAGALAFSTSANQYSLPGAYSIVPGGVSSSNYSISFVSGTLTITKASSSTALSMTPNPATRGQTVRLTATVTAVAPGVGTPSNNVQFINNGTVLGTAGLINGVATFNTSFSRKGTYSLTAVYSGDNGFTGSSGSGTLQVR